MNDAFAPTVGIVSFFIGIILLMSLISWSNPTGAVVVSRCLDSDGETGSVPGTVTLVDSGERTYADVCKDSRTVAERVCRGSRLATVSIRCTECVQNRDGIGYCKR